MFEYMNHASNLEEIKAFTEAKGLNVLLFSTTWCGDCMFANTFMEKVMNEYSDVNFMHVDRDNFVDYCAELDIMGIPSFVAFKDGREVNRFVSRFRKTEEEVKKFLDESK